MLDAGYHVLAPKPPALSLDDARVLAAAATRAERRLMIHFHRRFSYGVTEARRIMARASFGRLTQLSSTFCSGPYDAIRRAGYDDPVHAFLCDFATHHLDLARWLGGEVGGCERLPRRASGRLGVRSRRAVRERGVGTIQLNSEREWWRNYDRVELTGQGEHVVIDGLWAYRHYTASENVFSDNYSDERSTELGGACPALVE